MGWLFWARCPHHIHIITQQLILFPKSQHLGLHWENPIGAAHFSIRFSIQESTVLQTAFVSFKPAFTMFSPVNHPLNPCIPIHNQQCLKIIIACIVVQNISGRHKNTQTKGDTRRLSLPACLPVCCFAVTNLVFYLLLFLFIDRVIVKNSWGCILCCETQVFVTQREERTGCPITSIQSVRLHSWLIVWHLCLWEFVTVHVCVCKCRIVRLSKCVISDRLFSAARWCLLHRV